MVMVGLQSAYNQASAPVEDTQHSHENAARMVDEHEFYHKAFCVFQFHKNV
jgi:hypothetical protein